MGKGNIEEYVKVLLVSDEDGHNYIIPEFMKDDWRRLYNGCQNEDGTIDYDGIDEFNLKFSMYQVEQFSQEPIHVPLSWLQEREP